MWRVSFATDLRQTPAEYQTSGHELRYAPGKPLGQGLAVGCERGVVLATLSSYSDSGEVHVILDWI